MKVWLRRFLTDESGATAVEYGLLVILLSAALMAAIFSLGDKLRGIFMGMDAKLSG